MTPQPFRTLAVPTPEALLFGRAPRPVSCGTGLVIGGGAVHPEINFTLPPMLIEPGTWDAVRSIYVETMDNIVERAEQLGLEGLVVEFEQLPPMTSNAAWGAELTEVIKTRLETARERFGLKSAVRVTIIDLREEVKPPPRRAGESWDQMLAALEQSAARGGDILSIESTGGKEVHDVALTHADLPGIALALGVLAPADMSWLWDQFVGVANRHPGVIAGGDSACGFANTAMQLAEKRMLPEVLAALDRVMTCVRALVAFERGAVGPSKDCAYEGPVMKAIAGVPISMEGRSATCAHLSSIGNIAAAMTDLWSNESVPDVRLLSGPAPIASLESLVYDCRLFNAAVAAQQERVLRDLHVASDARRSPQAYVLTPDATIAIARAIVGETDPYRRLLAAARTAFELLRAGHADGAVVLNVREQRWLDKLQKACDALPPTAEELIAATRGKYGELYDPASYGL
jgi:methanol--5-hydroxybenzimidazolylcobamide Co-methyltransferase